MSLNFNKNFFMILPKDKNFFNTFKILFGNSPKMYLGFTPGSTLRDEDVI